MPMVIVYHKNNSVVDINYVGESIAFPHKNIAKILFEMAILYKDSLIIWCHIDLKSNLNIESFDDIFHHNKIMASYNPEENSFLSDAIGYVDGSPFLKINKTSSYPSWQMSSKIGGIHASILNELKNEFKKDRNFDYFLHSLAKLAMPNGLFCYSEPKLVKNILSTDQKNNFSTFLLFRFVKQHFKIQWLFLLLFNMFLYERKMPILSFLFSLFYRRRKFSAHLLDNIKVQSRIKAVESETIDIIIPTIGRKKYLYDILTDLSKQTCLPQNVIIVEQNPDPESVSELDYLTNETWPFNIKHTFTHQVGACNARNLAIRQVESEWAFLADDDIRCNENLLRGILNNLEKYGAKCLTTSCLQKNEVQAYKIIHQSGIFGSGNSVVKSEFLKQVSFNKALEFGYGEDTDFGLQLRNIGIDVIYFPELTILHLKAPVGGFRNKFIFPWELKNEHPRPSPTVMYVQKKYLTGKQLKGYKTILFLKLHKVNFFAISDFVSRWNLSIKWSEKL